jgi:hypothetical protein
MFDHAASLFKQGAEGITIKPRDIFFNKRLKPASLLNCLLHTVSAAVSAKNTTFVAN